MTWTGPKDLVTWRMVIAAIGQLPYSRWAKAKP